jgi:site-specific DNA recombinase
MRAALYARVSTEEQLEGYSIDAQRRAFHTLCEGRSWTPHYEYIEAGRSAHTDDIRKRPVFKQAIDDALAGQYDVLVVHKIDRFARKLRITLEYFDKLGNAGVGFVSIENQIDYSTPTGKFMLAMQGGLAELYSDNLSEECKKGWRERKAQGLYYGLLPFGAMKGEEGIPIPDIQEREINIDSHEIVVRNYEGLQMAFELAAQGKSDREIAIDLNADGYRTTGTHGSRAFSKDTVKDMLTNRFYIGYLPDGNGSWIKGKHEAFISEELFNMAQEQRARRCRSKNGSIRTKARTYSLSGMLWCGICKSKAGIHQGHNGKPRVYYRARAQGADCNCKATFLEIYEAQIEWYLENFVIPGDYQQKILEAHRKLEAAYDDIVKRRATLENRLARIKELYEWGHKPKDEYLADYDAIQRELRTLAAPIDKGKSLEKLAQFLGNIADAWREANQEQRNKLANTLFEQVWIEHNRVVGVKPREELKPFFQLSYEEHLKSSTCQPESLRGRMQYLWRDSGSLA